MFSIQQLKTERYKLAKKKRKQRDTETLLDCQSSEDLAKALPESRTEAGGLCCKHSRGMHMAL